MTKKLQKKTIQMLRKIGWILVKPDEWFSADRTLTINLANADPDGDDIKCDVMRVCEDQVWRNACAHSLRGKAWKKAHLAWSQRAERKQGY